MNKKTYIQPQMEAVVLQQQQLLSSSVKDIDTNLPDGDAIIIDPDTPAGDGFWGR